MQHIVVGNSKMIHHGIIESGREKGVEKIDEEKDNDYDQKYTCLLFNFSKFKSGPVPDKKCISDHDYSNKKVEVNSMNLIDRLKTYKETKKLSKDDLFIELRAADVPVSMITLTNWLSNKNEPSQMYRKALENFLAGADNDK